METMERKQHSELLKKKLKRDMEENLTKNNTIPSYIFSDPDVYKLEQENIFKKCWLFMGHVSEIPEKGDYVTRTMGEIPVIVSNNNGEYEVLLNVCTHRGMKLCRADAGNSAHFRCPYHGFTFKNNGELIGVPFQKDAYGSEMRKSDFNLRKAKVDVYKGLIFATWNENPEPLEDFLGDMKWYLDLVSGRAEMDIVGPPQRWEVTANWKLAAENFASDAYHTGHTHGSIVELGLAPKPVFAKYGHHINAGNGHGLGLGTGVPGSPRILHEAVYPEYKQNMDPDQYDTLIDMRNMHANVFPNLSIVIPTVKVDDQLVSVISLRLWAPKGPDKLDVYSWFLVEKNAPQEWKDKSHRGYILTFGSSGIFEQDDTENWYEITENSRKLLNGLDFTFDARMGVSREPIEPSDFPGPGKEIFDIKYNEGNSRSLYNHWKNKMLEE